MDKFKKVLQEMSDIHTAKNHDYGASADKTYEEFGLTAYLVRMSDKLNRAKTLMNTDAKVSDEKIRDTLIDLAVYSAMAVASMDPDAATDTSSGDGLFKKYLEILKVLGYDLPSWKVESMARTFKEYTSHQARIIYVSDGVYLFEVFGCYKAPLYVKGIMNTPVLQNTITDVYDNVNDFLDRFSSNIDIFDSRNLDNFIKCLDFLRHGKPPLHVNHVCIYDEFMYVYGFSNGDSTVTEVTFYS